MVETPRFIIDHIVSDGAQVTRPSIDPYREPVETHLYLFNGTLRLSMPVAIGGLRDLGKEEVSEVIRACYRMGVLVDLNGLTEVPEEALRRQSHAIAPIGAANSSMVNALQLTISGPDATELETMRPVHENQTLVARVPPLEDTSFYRDLFEAGFRGIIIDEDLDHHDAVELEVATSVCDRALKVPGPDGLPMRNLISLLVSSERLRSSSDAFKLIGLGAEVVVLPEAWKIAIDYRPQMERPLLSERLEYFLIGVQKELKLLAGAAGVSSLWTSLVGSRELFRSIELDNSLRVRLGVKSAGEW